MNQQQAAETSIGLDPDGENFGGDPDRIMITVACLGHEVTSLDSGQAPLPRAADRRAPYPTPANLVDAFGVEDGVRVELVERRLLLEAPAAIHGWFASTARVCVV